MRYHFSTGFDTIIESRLGATQRLVYPSRRTLEFDTRLDRTGANAGVLANRFLWLPSLG
jgi:hypothetical protein